MNIKINNKYLKIFNNGSDAEIFNKVLFEVEYVIKLELIYYTFVYIP